MNNKVISVKNESKLTGFLLLKINNLFPNAKAIYSGIINNNSNIRLYKNVFFNNDTSIITYTDGKSFLDKNIYKGVKINPISFDNGTSFNVNYSKKYDLGLYTINNSFPKTLLNVNGNENVFGLYLNNGLKSFWSDIKHGIAVKNFSTNNEQYIPINLNKKTITYTGTNTINNTYNGIININGNGSINYSETVNIINNNTNSEFKNINYINIPNTLSNEFKLIRNTNYVNVSGLITGFIQNSTIDSNAEITVKTSANNSFDNNSFNNNIFYMNDNIKTNISSYLLSGNYTEVAPYLNKNTILPYNILLNHYHDRYLKQKPTEINYNNIKYHYNSNVPIGSIIWWPESWVSNDITKKQIKYHLPYENNDWVSCDGRNVTNSLYYKLTQKNKVPNFLVSTEYIYKDMYNIEKKLIIADHYLNEPNAAWVLPRIAYIKPISFYSAGTTHDDHRRSCTYRKLSNGYSITTYATFANCTSRITFEIKSFLNISNLYYIFDVNKNGHKETISGRVSTETQKINVSYTNTAGGTFTIKCYNFRFKKEGNETDAILPLNRKKEDTYLYFEDHYRYGFGSQEKSIEANGYTNYGLFRRLVPIIKINDNKEFLNVLPPEPVVADTKVINVAVVRKNISNDLINSLNLSDEDVIGAKYLSCCYIPSNWNSFDNNVVCFLEYVRESELSAMTNHPVTLSCTNINGTNSSVNSILYIPPDDHPYFSNCYLFKNQDNNEQPIIHSFPNQLILSNLKQFFNNSNEYDDKTIINVDTRYTNISLSAIDTEEKKWKIYVNPQITLMSENYSMLNYFHNMLFSLPLQRSVNQPAPNLDYTDLSGHLYYAVTGQFGYVYGNLPFKYLDMTKPLLINDTNTYITNNYYLFGTETLMWDVNQLSDDLVISSYLNTSIFNAKSIAFLSRDLQPEHVVGEVDDLFGGFPSSYNILTTWLRNADPNQLHKKFFDIITGKTVINTSYANSKYYDSSLLTRENSDWGQCIPTIVNQTTRYIAYPSVKIPPKTTVLGDDNFTILSVTPENFDAYMNQYDNLIIKTKVNINYNLFRRLCN